MTVGDHNAMEELLATYALDAVPASEADAISTHLCGCPHCREEVDHLRELAAVLGNAAEAAPVRLWDDIAARIAGDPIAERTGPASEDCGSSASPESRPIRGRRRARQRRMVALAGVAAAVGGLLSFGWIHEQRQVSRLQGALNAALPADVVNALETPNHHIVIVENAQRKSVADFVITDQGNGYLLSSSLPTLDAAHTYQLWGLIGGQPISLGLLGRSPQRAQFDSDGANVRLLAISVEPTGGSIVPSSPTMTSRST